MRLTSALLLDDTNSLLLGILSELGSIRARVETSFRVSVTILDRLSSSIDDLVKAALSPSISGRKRGRGDQSSSSSLKKRRGASRRFVNTKVNKPYRDEVESEPSAGCGPSEGLEGLEFFQVESNNKDASL